MKTFAEALSQLKLVTRTRPNVEIPDQPLKDRARWLAVQTWAANIVSDFRALEEVLHRLAGATKGDKGDIGIGEKGDKGDKGDKGPPGSAGSVTPKRAKVLKTTPQSIANDFANVPIVWEQEEYDNDGLFTLATPTRFVVVTAGFYAFQSTIAFAPNTVGTRRVSLWQNGTFIGWTEGPPGPGAQPVLQVAGYADMLPGQFVEVQVYQNSGGALLVASTLSNFSCVRLGA